MIWDSFAHSVLLWLFLYCVY